MMPPMTAVHSVTTVADLVALVPDPPADGRRLIGIAGSPGAGKTAVAEALAAALGPDAVHVPMDGFHLSDVALERLGTRDRKGAPDTFDPRGYAALLARIRSDRDHVIYAPGFDRHLEQPIAASIVIDPQHRSVISEGNYLLLDTEDWADVRNRLDVVWFLTVDPEVRRSRLVARHVAFGKTPAFAAAWVERVDEPNAVEIEATAGTADRIIDVTGLRLDPVRP